MLAIGRPVKRKIESLDFERVVVSLISDGKADEALRLLSLKFGVSVPKLKVGRAKGLVRVHGAYVRSKKTIYLSGREEFTDAFVILHEFYHHLRSLFGKHRGTEKSADRFVLDFLRKAYRPSD